MEGVPRAHPPSPHYLFVFVKQTEPSKTGRLSGGGLGWVCLHAFRKGFMLGETEPRFSPRPIAAISSHLISSHYSRQRPPILDCSVPPQAQQQVGLDPFPKNGPILPQSSQSSPCSVSAFRFSSAARSPKGKKGAQSERAPAQVEHVERALWSVAQSCPSRSSAQEQGTGDWAWGAHGLALHEPRGALEFGLHGVLK